MGALPQYEHVPSHGGDDPSRRRDDCDWRECLFIMFVFICVSAVIYPLLSWLFRHIDQSRMPPEYSVAITTVSGLDPATDLRQGRGVLSPEFNLTVGIVSRSALAGGCIKPGTSIKVSYSHLNLPMASGRAPEMCVGPGQAAGPLPAVACGHDVAVPGYLVDSLAEELRRGEAMFQVELTGPTPEEDYSQMWSVVTCWVRVGEPAMGLPCHKTYKKMPEEDSGYVPHPTA